MKIGLSSRTCPHWSMETLAQKAAELGFDGVEIFGSQAGMTFADLAKKAESASIACKEAGVEFLCISTDYRLDGTGVEQQRQRERVSRLVELAKKVGARFARVGTGRIHAVDTRQAALARIAASVSELVPQIDLSAVTLLIGNGQDFKDSASLWFIVDTVGHPAVRAEWNQLYGLSMGELPSNSLPRLAEKLELVHLCDARLAPDHTVRELLPPGSDGEADVGKQIELLKGLCYNGYLVYDWPAARVDSAPDSEAILPQVAAFLKESIAATQPTLVAYKGDKNAPKFASRGAS